MDESDASAPKWKRQRPWRMNADEIVKEQAADDSTQVSIPHHFFHFFWPRWIRKPLTRLFPSGKTKGHGGRMPTKLPKNKLMMIALELVSRVTYFIFSDQDELANLWHACSQVEETRRVEAERRRNCPRASGWSQSSTLFLFTWSDQNELADLWQINQICLSLPGDCWFLLFSITPPASNSKSQLFPDVILHLVCQCYVESNFSIELAGLFPLRFFLNVTAQTLDLPDPACYDT